jgi:hyperosmotically inducible periplasmic protein
MFKKTLLTVGLLASALVAGCAAQDGHRSTGQALDDTGMTSRVKAALVQNPATKARDIKVETNRGVVQLAGFVDSEQEKAEAGKVARSIDGVQSVRNDLRVQPANRTAGEVVDDAMITAKVKTALIGDTRTKAHQINVDTKEGIVQLGGFVDSAQAKAAAAEVAESVTGVKSVRNELELK